jgi:small subunit ribosomal protein S5
MAREQNNRGRRERDEAPEFADRLVAINRVSKTVKGGKRFGFAALVVVGIKKAALALAKVKQKRCPKQFARPLSKPNVK